MSRTERAFSVWRARYAPTAEAMSGMMRAMAARRSHLLRLGHVLEAALNAAGFQIAETPELAMNMKVREVPPMD
jgi:hypothetical protein